MDDTEDDARYTEDPYATNHQQGYGSSNRQKLPVRSASYSRSLNDQYAEDEDEGVVEEDEESGEEAGENNENNGLQYMEKEVGDDDNNVEDEDADEEEDDDDEDDNQNSYRTDDDDLELHPKKRKVRSLASSYEFAPRVPAPSAAAPSQNPSFAGRNPLTDWTEHESFVLLDAWGDKFLQRGRKSLRSEEWKQVADKVSEESNIERTDTQCRNRLDTLKKKYKKEKVKLAEAGSRTSKWVYFKKMDMLMSTSAQQGGLSCGLDSGEYVFMNPKVYLNRANVLDEMRDSPGNSESPYQEEDDSDGLPPKKRRSGRNRNEVSSYRLLADSIQKFSKIYEKIENNRRQQMLKLEKMRMDFHRDLELQKRQIMEKAYAEIAKIRQGVDEDNENSADNASG